MFKLSSMQYSEPVVIQTRSQSRNEMNTNTEHLCIGQIEASTSPPGQPPGHLTFLKIIVQIPPLPEPKCRSNAPPARARSGNQMPSPRGHFTGT